MTTKKTIKSAFESLMFTWGEPLEARVAAEIFNISVTEATEYFLELADEYEQAGRGIRIRQVNKAFQFITDIDNADYIERLCTPVRMKKLSQSALEVLALIAYKQPVTKSEIEAVRGVRCDRVIEGLAAKSLIKETGRSTGIGRPILYGTTEMFLMQFGFTSLKDLPEIDDIAGVLSDEPDEYIDEIQQVSMNINEIN